MTWFQIWTVCWQIAMFVTPIVVATSVLWLRSQFVTKADARSESIRIDARLQTDKVERDQRYEMLRDKVVDHDARLRSTEADLAKPPSRHALNNSIAKLDGGVHSLGKSLDQLRDQMHAQSAQMQRQMETMSTYLHTVIEKHIA